MLPERSLELKDQLGSYRVRGNQFTLLCGCVVMVSSNSMPGKQRLALWKKLADEVSQLWFVQQNEGVSLNKPAPAITMLYVPGPLRM